MGQVETVRGPVEAGELGSCHIDWFPAGFKEQAAPDWNYTHIVDDVLPALREEGVTEEQLTTMLVDNPRRILEQEAS